jgi:potassium-dependent mechanosensitive channel
MIKNQSRNNRISLKISGLLVFILYTSGSCYAQVNQNTGPALQDNNREKQPYFRSPSAWLQSTLDRLNSIENSLLSEKDTTSFKEQQELFAKGLETTTSSIPELEANPNLRRFFNTRNRLNLINKDIENEKNNIRQYTTELYYHLDYIHGIRYDSAWNHYLADSSLQSSYSDEFNLLRSRVNEVDSLCQGKLNQYVQIEKTFNEQSLYTLKLKNRLTGDINKIRSKVMHAEEPPVWAMGLKKYPEFIDVLIKTAKIKFKALTDYSKSSLFELILMRILVLIFASLPVLYMKRIFKNGPETIYTSSFRYVHKHTAYLAAPIVLVFAPLLFQFPPMIFLDILLVSLVIAVSVITLRDIKTLNKYYIIGLLVYYIILKLFNVFTDTTIAERIFLSLSILVFAGSVIFIKNINRHNIRYKFLVRLLAGFCALHLLAGWIFCCLGNLILGKWLITSGLDGFFLILILFFTINGINDYILMAGDVLNRKYPEFHPDLNKFLKKLRPFQVFLAIVFWIAAYLMNTSLYESTKVNISHFLTQYRFIGDLQFTLSDIVIFFGFSLGGILLAGVLKPLLNTEDHDSHDKNSYWESYIFVLRLVIIFTGFILGITAAGLDLKNLNVLFGALGVGLGFGLQHIFNNLVSGVMIAFDRPFKIGDLLTLPEGSGRVKEIGLRSTILDTGEGAEIIVPNGNLISNIFSNWTLTNSRRKLTLSVQVSREADSGRVREILTNAIQETDGILSNPGPRVSFKKITENSLNFELDFWVSNMKFADNIQSGLNEKIAAELMTNQIGTPAQVQHVIINEKKK